MSLTTDYSSQDSFSLVFTFHKTGSTHEISTIVSLDPPATGRKSQITDNVKGNTTGTGVTLLRLQLRQDISQRKKRKNKRREKTLIGK